MAIERVLMVALIEDADLVSVRHQARQIAIILGFEKQDQTRIATAVSEIARNAMSYGSNGRINFSIDSSPPARMLISIIDDGPGMADRNAVLEGRFHSTTGMGVGISGSKRLMDIFDLQSDAQSGTTVTLGKYLPKNARPVDAALLKALSLELAAGRRFDPVTEMRNQNHELLQSLAALKTKQDEAKRLNAELEETNSGVVALYAELDRKAEQLSSLNGDLESRVAVAVADCMRANEALRQSQKMEAVGQLTGGLAHDFNNLLQIVLGNLELVLRKLPDGDTKLKKAITNAVSGAQRAASLTQRLLAFSRRQPLDPKPMDVNAMVEGMADLLRRTLGESITIVTHLARDLWIVEADINQLENALLNLAVNARDAMDKGGPLKITTTNETLREGDLEDDIEPGQYVSLAVCDAGSGISEAAMNKVFEPFFTTKEVGRGTGLGLSMVYGFVKQSGGHVRIVSSLGRGTTVSIYLPRVDRKPVLETTGRDVTVTAAGEGETILVVEDDADVRAFSCDVLSEMGYNILSAADGPSAIAIIDSDVRIDLVFTDVVLAGALNGRDVADRSRIRRPATPLLFTTGYAREAIVHHQRLDEGVDLLLKPFTFEGLSSKVRESLARTVTSLNASI